MLRNESLQDKEVVWNFLLTLDNIPLSKIAARVAKVDNSLMQGSDLLLAQEYASWIKILNELINIVKQSKPKKNDKLLAQLTQEIDEQIILEKRMMEQFSKNYSQVLVLDPLVDAEQFIANFDHKNETIFTQQQNGQLIVYWRKETENNSLDNLFFTLDERDEDLQAINNLIEKNVLLKNENTNSIIINDDQLIEKIVNKYKCKTLLPQQKRASNHITELNALKTFLSSLTDGKLLISKETLLAKFKTFADECSQKLDILTELNKIRKTEEFKDLMKTYNDICEIKAKVKKKHQALPRFKLKNKNNDNKEKSEDDKPSAQRQEIEDDKLFVQRQEIEDDKLFVQRQEINETIKNEIQLNKKQIKFISHLIKKDFFTQCENFINELFSPLFLLYACFTTSPINDEMTHANQNIMTNNKLLRKSVTNRRLSQKSLALIFPIINTNKHANVNVIKPEVYETESIAKNNSNRMKTHIHKRSLSQKEVKKAKITHEEIIFFPELKPPVKKALSRNDSLFTIHNNKEIILPQIIPIKITNDYQDRLFPTNPRPKVPSSQIGGLVKERKRLSHEIKTSKPLPTDIIIPKLPLNQYDLSEPKDDNKPARSPESKTPTTPKAPRV